MEDRSLISTDLCSLGQGGKVVDRLRNYIAKETEDNSSGTYAPDAHVKEDFLCHRQIDRLLGTNNTARGHIQDTLR